MNQSNLNILGLYFFQLLRAGLCFQVDHPNIIIYQIHPKQLILASIINELCAYYVVS